MIQGGQKNWFKACVIARRVHLNMVEVRMIHNPALIRLVHLNSEDIGYKGMHIPHGW